ncbi:MAG: uncharacterized protein A8A55_1797 [Amphiamblys sp. WSBS2006]|nr:MAG: uncharacterized protein A8A55_1797 [Amphiamblys sp. WSBS2006]
MEELSELSALIEVLQKQKGELVQMSDTLSAFPILNTVGMHNRQTVVGVLSSVLSDLKMPSEAEHVLEGQPGSVEYRAAIAVLEANIKKTEQMDREGIRAVAEAEKIQMRHIAKETKKVFEYFRESVLAPMSDAETAGEIRKHGEDIFDKLHDRWMEERDLFLFLQRWGGDMGERVFSRYKQKIERIYTQAFSLFLEEQKQQPLDRFVGATLGRLWKTRRNETEFMERFTGKKSSCKEVFFASVLQIEKGVRRKTEKEASVVCVLRAFCRLQEIVEEKGDFYGVLRSLFMKRIAKLLSETKKRIEKNRDKLPGLHELVAKAGEIYLGFGEALHLCSRGTAEYGELSQELSSIHRAVVLFIEKNSSRTVNVLSNIYFLISVIRAGQPKQNSEALDDLDRLFDIHVAEYRKKAGKDIGGQLAADFRNKDIEAAIIKHIRGASHFKAEE